MILGSTLEYYVRALPSRPLVVSSFSVSLPWTGSWALTVLNQIVSMLVRVLGEMLCVSVALIGLIIEP
jgi:hypothetical protein